MNTQERALVVTDKFIYKLDPQKNFKMKKDGLPINDIQSASISEQRDQLVVLNLRNIENDLIFYIDAHDKTHDRVAELLANIHRIAIKYIQ